MAWREALLIRFGSGTLSGITLGRWLRVLRDNDYAVDFPYWLRALGITLGSLPNSLHAWRENRVYGERVRNTKVEPPLFILGIWRSGTTLLHNLLTQDERFAYPNNYQVCYPETFLTTEESNARVVQFFLPKTRPQDNMKISVQEPQEDEFAFSALTGRTVPMGWAFCRRADHYDRYLTFREASAAEVAEWKAALTRFVQKLAFKYGKPLILKSPPHTGRIKLLLELFPDARFVHIHRNPYDVFQSTQHTLRKVAPWFALQRPRFDVLDDRIIRQYRQGYDAFFEERGLIPKGRYCEVGYEALEADPVGRVRDIYDALGLPDFKVVEETLRRYVATLSGYKKNTFAQMPAELRSRLGHEWRRCFEEWGYPN
jgi:omega-hydroxy-beta-dihydromenaquinone-9 sulfotransferase